MKNIRTFDITKRKTKFFIFILLSAATLTLTINCGKNKISNSASSNVDYLSRTKPVAICTRDVGKNSDLSVSAMAYKENYSSSYRDDYIRLKFTTIPSEFQTNSDFAFQVYRWKVSSTGAVSLDETPLQLYFEQNTNGSFESVGSSGYTDVMWTDIDATLKFLGTTVGSGSEFFNRFNMVVNLKDAQRTYQALRIVFYNGNTVARTADLLIPSVYADPNDYKWQPSNSAAERPLSIQQLHPFYYDQSNGWTAEQYLTDMNTFCF